MGALNALAISRITEPGFYADGGGLYLEVAPSGSKSWLFMFKRTGRRTAVGLGGYPNTGLALAREKAEAARKTLAAGGDPLAGHVGQLLSCAG